MYVQTKLLGYCGRSRAYVGEVQLHLGEVQPYFGEVQRYFGIKGSSNENRLNLSQTAGTGTLLYRESKYAITGLYR